MLEFFYYYLFAHYKRIHRRAARIQIIVNSTEGRAHGINHRNGRRAEENCSIDFIFSIHTIDFKPAWHKAFKGCWFFVWLYLHFMFGWFYMACNGLITQACDCKNLKLVEIFLPFQVGWLVEYCNYAVFWLC